MITRLCKLFKFIFIFIILILIFIANGCVSNEKKIPILQKLIKQGKVKTIRESSYEAIDVFGSISKGKRSWESQWDRDKYYMYNEKGFLIEERYYYSDGGLKDKILFKYDDKGNNIESNFYKGDGSPNGQIIEKYDEKGNCIESKSIEQNNKLIYSYKAIFDNNSFEKELWSCNYNPEECEHRISSKNYNNKMIESKLYDSKDSLKEKSISKYNDNWECIESNTFYPNGDLKSKEIYKYENNGNTTIVIKYNTSGGVESKSTSLYNENGDLIEKSQYSSMDEKEIRETFEYEYDLNKVWKHQTKFINGMPKFILEREIEYR